MGSLEEIKKLVGEGTGNLKMLKYLLWYIESLETELTERRKVIPKDEADAYIINNFPNWIASHRQAVDAGTEKPEEYEQWFREAKKNSEGYIVGGKFIKHKWNE